MFLSSFSNFIDAQVQYEEYATAAISTRWVNTVPPVRLYLYADGSLMRTILLRGIGGSSLGYVGGFYCNGNCTTYVFAICIVAVHTDSGIPARSPSPQVVWSTNRNNPVKDGATFELSPDGLVLTDVDNMVAWSTNTSGKSVVRLNLTDSGNLVLVDKDNVTVWQSHDEPTDSLVLGQKLEKGQRLMASVSETNWPVDGMITLSLNSISLIAQLETNPPQIYFKGTPDLYKEFPEILYVEFVNGSLSWFSNSTSNGIFISVPQASSTQYMKLCSDGHLRLYEFMGSGWLEVADLFEKELSNDCDYPTVCGRYGICSDGQCSCPASSGGTSYFQQVNDTKPNLGCFENVPLSCGASKNQSLLELENVTYFGLKYFSLTEDLMDINASSCKEACARNCSCKAAIFWYESERTSGNCYLPTQVFSLINIAQKRFSYNSTSYNSIAYLKVQNVANGAPIPPIGNHTSNRLPVILGSSLGALFAMMILIVAIVLFVQKRDENQAKEAYHVPGMPTSFTYDDLKTITEEFSKELGKGGFGSVFEGTLKNGTKVAVKRLKSLDQVEESFLAEVKKSFLAEVETIGSLHHVNLVRLVGFCNEKSHMLLIYEYMSNGSLDKWIFHRSNGCALNWQQKKKIILDIAKGLNYLHEDCRKKILHLDIKSQNILLDGNFNAKVADFGLSKFIDKDQSRIVTTTIRGTLGYMAPERHNAIISVEVDVYSFGVVILEILCGKKISDDFPDEEDECLLSLFKRKAEEERLLDIVDKSNADMHLNGPNAVNMMRIAAWCLQRDYKRRPPMSMVIKALEGDEKVPEDLDYDFFAQPSSSGATTLDPTTATLRPSILSGPR
ncbi:hypothetical protein EUGRSUZ_K03230 [Eucalyptus grandis]|uniref:Uncharacterized protein n=2 Tax=Eucalyptus grandis TaxID=71139 RepID=A0ACC3J1N9_EUCGR|nr:hypothetical protein EUGRSUZ_K03230 [Eucalyptus grandis]